MTDTIRAYAHLWKPRKLLVKGILIRTVFSAWFVCFGFSHQSSAAPFSVVLDEKTRKHTSSTSNFIKENKNRLELDLRLYTQNNELVLQLPNQKRVIFTPQRSRVAGRLFRDHIHYHKTIGKITSKAKRRIWQFNRYTSVEFLGSYPIKISTPNHKNISLNYKQQRLISMNTIPNPSSSSNRVYDSALSEIQAFIQVAAALACPNTEGTQSASSPDPASMPTDSPIEDLTQEPDATELSSCNDESISPPTGFDEPTDDNVIRVDVRPADCFSYFTAFSSIDRGTEIEQALSQQVPYLGSESGGHSFPIADFWNNGQVFVVISRDLTAASYDPIENPTGLYDQILQDGENIQQNLVEPLANEGAITHTELGETTTLTAEDAQVIYLDVVVQYGVTSPAQQAMLDQAAADLLAQYGFVLRIIEIP